MEINKCTRCNYSKVYVEVESFQGKIEEVKVERLHPGLMKVNRARDEKESYRDCYECRNYLPKHRYD